MKKEYSNYHKEYYGNKQDFKKKFLIGLLVVFLVASFVFLFYNNSGLTGRAVEKINYNNSIEIVTSFSIPEVDLDGAYEEIVLYLDGGAVLKIDNKKINLEENENEIILKNFKGEINLNEDYLTKLTGKVSEIKINNLPLTLQEEGKIKISLSENSRYSFFEIDKGVYLNKVFFTTSGSLLFGGDLLNLNSEKIELKNYFGKLTIKDKKLILDGFIESLNIEGSSRKLSLSK